MSVKRGHEITLVWQVFVMLCVKSFDYKATMTALINDLCVFVLSVCFCECVRVLIVQRRSATSFTLWSLPIVTPTVGQTTAEYTLTKLTFVLWGHAHNSQSHAVLNCKFNSIHYNIKNIAFFRQIKPKEIVTIQWYQASIIRLAAKSVYWNGLFHSMTLSLK